MNRVCAVFLALLALAATPAPEAAAATPQNLVPSNRLTIAVDVNQGQLVRLTHAVNSVFIADPTIADVQVKSPQLIYVIGKAAGQTTLYAVTDKDDVVLNAAVNVHYDASRVQRAIRDLVPHSDVTVSAVADSLVLSGTVYSAADGDSIRTIAQRFVKDPKQLINDTKVDAPNQINLRVRIAEMSRNVIKQFGFNWENVFNNGHIIFGIATGTPALVGALTGTSTLPDAGMTHFAVPPGSTTNAYNVLEESQLGGATNNNLFGGIKTKNLNVNSLIDALDDHGLVTILAEPNLTAISGEPASFLAGGQFPIPVPAGNGLVGIDWKNFGVSLNFVATILSGDRISLHVMPEVSELSATGAITIDGVSVPALTTRRAETTVELGSGQAFAIAGLLQNNVSQNINKFPWLGDVPILGQLFRSEAFQRNESELVIIVTPYLVHPIAVASQARAPTDGFVPASDSELVLHGSEYQQGAAPAGQPPHVTGAALVGPVGFDLQ